MRTAATIFAGIGLGLYVWYSNLFPLWANSASPYSVGQVVHTSKLPDENRPYLSEGWSFTTPGGIWTDGPKAIIDLQLIDSADSDLTFQIHGSPYLDDNVRRQRVIVSADGKKLGEWVFEDDKRPARFINIPASLISSRKLTLTLDLPDAAVAKGGKRRLALSLKTFALTKN